MYAIRSYYDHTPILNKYVELGVSSLPVKLQIALLKETKVIKAEKVSYSEERLPEI